jgi:valyl-tRNA synthetase
MDKKYNFSKFEKESQRLWNKNQTYKFEKDSAKKVFSIDTPPPTVSGRLHIGHIFSYTQTDLIARYKRMQNYNVFYPMGFDDNGLPTERFVEKKNKTKAHLLKRSEFIDLCLKESLLAEKSFEELWKSIGLSVDWEQAYFTISGQVRKISQYSFLDLYKKNLIYRKEEPSLYCTTCRTSVAQAELEDIEKSTTFNDIEFLTQDGEKLIISTTRPELLPACVAVFYNPKDTRYSHLKDKVAITPIFEREVKIIPDEKVDIQKGSGLVMCCTFGDQMDIEWQKKHSLPFVHIVGFDGKWTKDAGELEGLRAHEARKKTLELLEKAGKLKNQKKITHAVNVHERCQQDIEYLILPQWFIKILEHKKDFLDAAEKINWKPEYMKSRYKNWVENLAWDWCISRQRFYGVPFPVWHCQDCGQVILAEEKDLPIDPQEKPYPGKCCPKCKSENLKAETDIMDTWATSSLTPQINLNWPEENKDLNLPMDLRPQAHDIIRTWAFYTIVKAHYHNKDIPWKNIAISGYVTADGKEKISKSKGNAKLTPESLLTQHSADSVRYWAANGRLGTDSALSENQFKIGNRLITKLWNAFRFCSEHISSYKKTPPPKLNELNKWLLHKYAQTLQSFTKHFDEYEYTYALADVEKFFWKDFCDNYLEIVKDQFFNPQDYDEQTIEGTKFTLYEIGFGILQLFAPFLPHITETLYQQLFKESEGETSIHKTIFEQERYNYKFVETSKLIDLVIEIISSVRKLKSENAISLKTEIKELKIFGPDEAILEMLKTQEKIITGVTKAKSITFINDKLDANSMLAENDIWTAQINLGQNLNS